jgi:hypothetical protein
MPRPRKKPVQYKTIKDFPEKIAAYMIERSFLGFKAQTVRYKVETGEWKGIIIGRNTYMTKAQFVENFGGQISA